MFDPTAVLISNLSEALRQASNYLTLGLATAISAFILDRRQVDTSRAGDVTVPGVAIAVAPGTAKMLLLGLCWVAGAMASYALEAAGHVTSLLQAQPDVLRAACSFPSLATAPIGYGIAAAALPVAFVTPVVWRMHKAIRAGAPQENTFLLFMVFLIPYGAVGLSLWHLGCR